ncbi:MAG: thiamine phosphate synthase [Terricaulis sp.]
MLAAQARRLNRDAGAPAVPSLYFFTDPARTPDPVAIARRLPRGAAVVYRHFGAEDRVEVADALAAQCRIRGLALLIGADLELARRVGAGVHWPERLMPSRRTNAPLVTVSAHTRTAVTRAADVADACVISPVFPTRSAAGRKPLGLFAASQIARAAALPIIALGGVTTQTARRLAGRGFAGLAAVDAFLEVSA